MGHCREEYFFKNQGDFFCLLPHLKSQRSHHRSARHRRFSRRRQRRSRRQVFASKHPVERVEAAGRRRQQNLQPGDRLRGFVVRRKGRRQRRHRRQRHFLRNALVRLSSLERKKVQSSCLFFIFATSQNYYEGRNGRLVVADHHS